MKLISLVPFTTVNILGIRTMNTVRIKPDDSNWKDWRVTVKGASVFLESPPGFRYGGGRDDSKTRLVAEIPRAGCHLEWELEDGERVEEIGAQAQQQAARHGGK